MAAVILFTFFFLHSVKADKCAENFIEKFLGDQTLFLVHTSDTLINLQNPKILFNIESPSKFISFEQFAPNNVHYVFEAENARELNDFLKRFSRYKRWNPKLKHLIILKELNAESAKHGFESLWFHDVYNAVIISYFSFEGYTWYPFEKESKCGSFIYLKSFNVCSNFDPFSTKAVRTQECSIKITLHPRLAHLANQEGSKHIAVVIKLLKWIKQRLRVAFTQKHKNHAPNITDEQYVSQLFQEMETEKIDVISNNPKAELYPFHDGRWEMSATFYCNEIVWVMPPKRRVHIREMLFRIFSPSVWLNVVLAYLLLLTVWHFAKNSSLFSIIRMIFCQSIRNTNYFSSRIILASLLFLNIHVSLFFTSRFISLLTDPYQYRLPTTWEQLANLQVKFAYSKLVSDALRETNYNIWKQLQLKRVNATRNLEYDKYLEFLSHHFNDSHLVFSIDSLMLHYYVKNLEQILIHPMKVFSNATNSVFY